MNEENYIYMTSPYAAKRLDYDYTISLINKNGDEILPIGLNKTDHDKRSITWPTFTHEEIIEGTIIRNAKSEEVTRCKLNEIKHCYSGDVFKLNFAFTLN